MLTYTIRRLLIMIPTLLVISFVTFSIIKLPPGDYLTNQIAELRSQGDKAALERVEFLRKQYGRSVMGEVLERAVNDSSQQALVERGLRPALQPSVEVTAFAEGADLEYKLAVELLPEIVPTDLRMEHATLDDAFLALTGHETGE